MSGLMRRITKSTSFSLVMRRRTDVRTRMLPTTSSCIGMSSKAN